MDEIIIPALYVIAGFTLLTAIQHSLAGKYLDSEHRRVHRLFALACYFLAAMIFTRAQAYGAGTVQDLIAIRRWEIAFLLAGLVFLAWFFASYTNIRPQAFLVGLTLFWMAMLVVNMFLPFGVQFAERPDRLPYIELPWGETVVDLRVYSKSIWHIVGSISVVLLFAFGLYAAYWLQRNEPYSRGKKLVIALSVYFLTVIFNLLANWGLIEFIHISDFGIAGLLLFMNNELMQQARSENQRVRELLDHLPVAISLKDLKGRYIHVNKRFSDLFGVKMGRTSGTVTDADVFAPGVEKSITEIDNSILKHGQDVEWEYSHRFPEKSSVFRLQQFPICKDSNLIALCNLYTDITDDQEKDAKLAKLRLQVWRSDRVASTNSISKSIAHEISQPLSAILSNAQAGLRFLGKQPLDTNEIREIFEDIVRDERRAGAVVNSLRSMLQRRETEHALTDFGALIHEVVEFLHTELTQHSVDLKLKLEPDLHVWANKTQLQQVMLNLIMNSIEAMEATKKDCRRLNIKAYRKDDQLCVSVSDTGCGIPAESLEQVFEGFYTTKPKGLGIGLEICGAIMESHRGQIWVKNNSGKGATFSFRLPVSPSRKDPGSVIEGSDCASPN